MHNVDIVRHVLRLPDQWRQISGFLYAVGFLDTLEIPLRPEHLIRKQGEGERVRHIVQEMVRVSAVHVRIPRTQLKHFKNFNILKMKK